MIRRFSSSDRLNKDIRIAGILGQPIQASLAGKAVFVADSIHDCGSLVIIQHDASHASTCVRNSRLLVKKRQMINKDQKIAEAGSPDTDWVQLHFEIHQNDRPLDPLNLLPPS